MSAKKNSVGGGSKVVMVGAVKMLRCNRIRQMLRRGGLSVTEIAARAGVSYPSVSAIMKTDLKKDIVYNVANNRETRLARASEAAALVAQKMTLSEIAAYWGVSVPNAVYTLKTANVKPTVQGKRGPKVAA